MKSIFSFLSIFGVLLSSVLSCFLCEALAGQALFTEEKAPLYLEVGEQRLLGFSSLQRYSVSGNAVHYTRIPGQNQILLKAIRAGTATLSVLTSEPNDQTESETRVIRVEQRKNLVRPAGLLQALNSLNRTEVLDQGDQFVLRGRVREMKEARAIANILEKYGTSLVDETEIESNWYQQNLRDLSVLLKTYPTLTLQEEEGGLAVRGGLSSASLALAVQKKIKDIQPLTKVEIQTLKDSTPTIYFKVFLLEVKKELISSIGTRWANPNTALFQVSPAKFLVSNTINLSINTLSEKGLLRILSSPELVVRVPGQAELFAGGEMPIRHKTPKTEVVIWKSIGLSLKLDVKEFGGEKVRLSLETEMNHFDSTMANDNIPGISSNKLKTMVDGTMGKPLLLSGLLQEGLRERAAGLPMLSKIPVLGKLFGSEDYQKDRSELVAILLPHREPPPNPQARIASELPKGFVPLTRTYLDSEEREELKNDKNYPWNVL